MGVEIARIDPSETAIAPTPTHAVQIGTLHADSPVAVIEAASAIATPLAELIRTRNLASKISGREYVRCEGWTTLAVMLGVTPHEVSVVEEEGVYTATVELRTIADGKSIARASAECGSPDEVWGKRPKYARRSMALTRATGKACRMAFSWIMVLSGYEATPYEEMPDDDVGPPTPRAARQSRAAERAAAGDIDTIRQLLKAPIGGEVRAQVNNRIAKGMTPEQAKKCIEYLRGLIANLDADESDAEPRTASGPNKALDEAKKLYRATIDEHAPHLALDDDERDAFETRVVGRSSKQNWTINNYRKAIAALEAGEVELPPEDADEAA